MLRLRERDLAAESPGEDLRQVRLIARHDSPVGQRHADGGQLRGRLRRLDVGGPELEEVTPPPWVLGARDLPGLCIHNRELPIADDTALGDLRGVQLLAHHRFHRVTPKCGD